MNNLSAVGLFLISIPGSSIAQSHTDEPAFPPPGSVPLAVSFFAPFFIPKLLQDAYQLKDYVCSEEFLRLRQQHGDVHSVDALFDQAIHLAWGNAYEALFISLLVVLEHRRVDFRLPVVGVVVPIPLTPEFEEEFQRRVRCLPAKLYPDSPQTPYGDKDKLQHFFGSALLTYTSESDESADRVGEFVELGESRYVPGETIDKRDIRTNRQGQEFGLALLGDSQVRPSEFILRGWRKDAKDAAPSDSVSMQMENE